ncbi:MAG: transcriptional repressor [Methylobacteriaceae bacterium]|nr:transcriptional repressor [Methylobacteriaceae bacterium]
MTHHEHSEPNALQSIRNAERLCALKGLRLTSLRRKILEALLVREAPVKAYDLIDYLREDGLRLTPATVYRTLEFLLQHGLAHRVNALNAYVPCTCDHPHEALLLFICSECRRTEEIDDPALCDSLHARLGGKGISLSAGSTIEIQGTCPNCAH